jgi:peroxiredoxin
MLTIAATASYAVANPKGLIELPDKPLAPEFTLTGTDGKTYSLSQFRGKVLVVNFWATWCEPCRREFPAMDRAMHGLAARNVHFLAINAGDSPAQVGRFLAAQPVAMPVLLDEGAATAAAWQVQGLPTTYVVAADGRIVYGAIGARDWSAPELLAQVAALAPH